MARWTVLIVLRRIPIGHPLPYVPRHVIGPIRTLASLIAPNRSRRAIAVIDRVVFPFERTVAVAEIWVVYLQRAGKYKRPAWRPSQGQKGLDERALMASQSPSPPW